MNPSKNRVLLLAACTFAFLTAPLAFAGGDKDHHFDKMDSNGDGKISRTEHAAGAKAMFTECDANSDGMVTVAEMEAATLAKGDKMDKHAKSAAEKIRTIDQNGDAQLTTSEHEAGSEKMFAKMDTDSDGFLSKEESKEGMKKMKKDK